MSLKSLYEGVSDWSYLRHFLCLSHYYILVGQIILPITLIRCPKGTILLPVKFFFFKMDYNLAKERKPKSLFRWQHVTLQVKCS